MEIFTFNVLRPFKYMLLGCLFLLSALQPIRSEAATHSKKLVPENRNTGKLLFTPLNAPVMTSFSPASGPVGTLVTITGTDLSDPTAITIGGVTAIVVSNTGSSLVAMVMPGATNGLIAVTTGGGTTTSTASFTVTASALPNSQQGAKMAGDGTGLLPRRGGSVSMTADGNMAIVGENKGAWIYTRNGSTWTKDQFQLVGSGVSGSIIAAAVSISADGNTAMIGGYYDNSDKGAIWFFTRNVSNNEWTQQGNKIVVGTSGAEFGWSVALSADGNTAISGAINDSGAKGAVYFFTRSSSGTWSPQSGKIVGTGGISIGQFGPKFGQSVALSADGNTAIVGGPNDNDGMGAVWFFTRTGDEWTQQNDKIIGNADMQSFGTSVSLSADGNTAIIGGGDYNGTGAAWVFTRTEDTWTQQGDILVGTGAIGNSAQGVAVSLSADGNTAIVGGPWDNESPTYKTAGAFWIYSRSTEGIWTQQGEKLIDAGGSTEAQFGADVALSADGSTAIVGGPADNGQKGSVWFFASTPPPAITSAAYDASAGELVVTGTDFVAAEGENNDIIANKFTLTGEGGATYTLTDSENPEITNTTSFTIALSTTDFAAVQSIFNKNGSSSAGETTYNLAATQGWTVGDIEDLLNNNVTVSHVGQTKVVAALCGATLTNIDGEVNANPVVQATAYRFRVTSGASVQTVDREENVFQLTQLGSFAYSTTYTIDVAAEVDGVWSAYGSVCEVTTPAPFSNISGFLCGTTLDNNMEIYADHAPLATKYRFRVKHGSNEDFVEAEDGFFRMGEQSFFAYNTTYTIDVAVEVDGAWSDYGTACEVATTPNPTTKLVDAYCGETLENIDTEILADGLPLATHYRFRVSDGTNVQTVETEENFFQLTSLASFAYSTTYTIDVATEIDGGWTGYGTACEVTTPAPITKLASEFEDATLENMDAEIYADGLPLATGYRFRITNGASVQTIDKGQEENVFRMSQLPSFAYSTTYTIDVAAEIDGVWTAYGTAYNVSTPAPTTKIADEFCGKTLTTASGEIYADMPPLVTAYRFRVKEGENEQIIDSDSEYLNLSDLSFYAYNTTYTIDVAVEVEGVWSDYGTACEVTTTATPTTKLEDAYCGQTLENIDTEIYADNVPLATHYRFRATEGANVQTIDKEEPVIRMVHFDNFAYNTTYSIDVAVQIDGVWSDYGSACAISTPQPPLTQISPEFCGTTLENFDSEIYANYVYLATAYRFRVTNGADVQTMDTETGDFRLKEMSGIAYNTTYTIDVAVKVGGTWSAYGPACDVTMPTGIINISSSSPDGGYGIGSVIPIIVNFSSAVNVTGIPVLNLNSGGTATYTSGDESSALTFTYTVKADENADDLDYTDNHSLELSGGSIEDGNGHPVDLNLPDPDESGSLAANNDLVIDGTLPTLTDVVILSNNSNTALARTGDVVTVNFTSSEALAVPEVTISGQTADVVLLQDNDWAATYTMTNDDTEGEILFSIAFSDVAGNAGTNVTATTNSSSVTFDPTTLPVSLIDYQVKLKNNSSIVITWLTTMERNNQGFELFKSIDGISFNKIATLKGNGNTEVANLYSFVDGSPAKGTNYYRLIQIDANGDRNEVGLKTIRFDFQEPNNVLVFPNPASDRVNITFEAGKFTSLTLIDLTGKTILQQPVNSAENKKTISLTGLPATTYLIRLSGQSETVSRLLIINH